MLAQRPMDAAATPPPGVPAGPQAGRRPRRRPRSGIVSFPAVFPRLPSRRSMDVAVPAVRLEPRRPDDHASPHQARRGRSNWRLAGDARGTGHQHERRRVPRDHQRDDRRAPGAGRRSTPDDVRYGAPLAREAQAAWAERPLKERAKVLLRLARPGAAPPVRGPGPDPAGERQVARARVRRGRRHRDREPLLRPVRRSVTWRASGGSAHSR